MRKLKTKRDVLDFVDSLSPAEAAELSRLLEHWSPGRAILVINAGRVKTPHAEKKKRRRAGKNAGRRLRLVTAEEFLTL